LQLVMQTMFRQLWYTALQPGKNGMSGMNGKLLQPAGGSGKTGQAVRRRSPPVSSRYFA
jgi:hypothetical protein